MYWLETRTGVSDASDYQSGRLDDRFSSVPTCRMRYFLTLGNVGSGTSPQSVLTLQACIAPARQQILVASLATEALGVMLQHASKEEGSSTATICM